MASSDDRAALLESARQHVAEARLFRREGRLDEGARAFEVASALYERLGDNEAAAGASNAAGTTRLLAAAYDPAREAFLRATALAVGPSRAAASALGNLGLLARERGDLVGAATWFHQGRERHLALGNRVGAAECLGNLGLNALARSDLATAEHTLQGALDEFQALGQAGGAVTALNALGDIRRSLGDTGGAREFFQRSLALAEVSGVKEGRRIALQNLAHLSRLAGDLAGALEAYSVALSAARHDGDVQAASAALTNMAHTHAAQGRRDAARGALGECLELNQTVGRAVGVATAQSALAALDMEEGGLADVLVRLLEARGLFAGAAREREALLVSITAGQVHGQLGQLAEARALLGEVSTRAAACGLDPIALAADATLAGLGVGRGPLASSEAALHQCALRFEGLEDRRGLATARALLADVCAWQGRWDDALGLSRECRAFYDAAGAPGGLADVSALDASIAERRGHWQAARDWYRDALHAYRGLGLPLGEARCLTGLARCALAHNDVVTARADLEAATDLWGRFPVAGGLVEAELLGAWCHWLGGDVDAARAALGPAVDGCRRLELRLLEARALWLGALVGTADEAARCADQATTLEEALGAASGVTRLPPQV